MIIKKAYKYRIYPNNDQQANLAKQFGASRFVYNAALSWRKAHFFEHRKGLNYHDTAYMLTALKRFVPWLKEADSQVLQQSLKDLQAAYERYFEMVKTSTLPKPQLGQKPRRDGMPLGYPTYKSKYDVQSIRYPQRFKVNGSRIYLPKVGWVRAVFHRPTLGKMKNCTVSKTKSGKYFVSIQCEVEVQDPTYDGPTLGIDLGLKHFATLSNGQKIDHPQYLRKAERRLKRLQRRFSRTQKGSKGREQARLAVAKQHEKIANQRKDFLHQTSRRIVNEFGYVKIENLNVCGLLKNHHLAKSIADSGWGMFGCFLGYKGDWYGCYVEKIDRFYPSSKTCHVCGLINQELQLKHRFWTCEGCRTQHDRDHNASINIERYVPAERREQITPVDNLQGWLKPEAQVL